MGNLSAALNSPVHDDVLLAEYRACDLRRLTESEVIWREDLRGRKFLSSVCGEEYAPALMILFLFLSRVCAALVCLR